MGTLILVVALQTLAIMLVITDISFQLKRTNAILVHIREQLNDISFKMHLIIKGTDDE